MECVTEGASLVIRACIFDESFADGRGATREMALMWLLWMALLVKTVVEVTQGRPVIGRGNSFAVGTISPITALCMLSIFPRYVSIFL